ncbi:MAG: aldehyde dehydrogenase family protein [Spirochaetales bacterium]|nr:aldehyde dehydrogenase family protein [Spirochaetales bacterium]
MDYTISYNPATGKEIAKYQRNTKEEVIEAIKKSKAASKLWSQTPVKQRIKAIKNVQRYLIDNYKEVAKAICDDNGKLLIDSFVAEVFPAIMATSFYTKYAKKWLKPKNLKGNSILTFNKKAYMVYSPYGVIGIISPWNYPFSIPFSEVVMAILAGNGVILKVATETIHVGNILNKAFEAAKLPDGLFSYVNSSGPDTLDAFIEGSIDKIFFTGSVETGLKIQQAAAKKLIPTVLELGGNDAAIVLKDCDIDKATWGIIWGGYTNSGQSCGGAQRILVDKSIYDQFCEKIKEKVTNLRPPKVPYNETIGDADIGFITSKTQKETVIKQIVESIEKGAILYGISYLPEDLEKQILTEDERKDYIIKVRSSKSEALKFLNKLLQVNNNFLPAMVLTDIKEDMPIFNDEIFGPVIGITYFEDIEQAINMANDSKLGLTSSVWTSNIKEGKKIASKIEVGVVMINDHLMSHGLAHTPWGGVKLSGIGRTHGEDGFYEMLSKKVIISDSLTFAKKQLWWHPYSKIIWDGMVGAMKFLYHKSLKEKFDGLKKLFKLLNRFFEKN